MAKQYSTVARIFIDKGIHNGFISDYGTLSIALVNIKTDTLGTHNPSFASEFDVTPSEYRKRFIQVNVSAMKSCLYSNYFNETYSDPTYELCSFANPTFDICQQFVAATKRIESAISRKYPAKNTATGCTTDYFEKLLEVAKVDAIWFEAQSEYVGKSRFTVYKTSDLETLMIDAAMLLK